MWKIQRNAIDYLRQREWRGGEEKGTRQGEHKVSAGLESPAACFLSNRFVTCVGATVGASEGTRGARRMERREPVSEAGMTKEVFLDTQTAETRPAGSAGVGQGKGQSWGWEQACQEWGMRRRVMEGVWAAGRREVGGGWDRLGRHGDR